MYVRLTEHKSKRHPYGGPKNPFLEKVGDLIGRALVYSVLLAGLLWLLS